MSCVLAPDILLAGRSQGHCYSIREETEAQRSLTEGICPWGGCHGASPALHSIRPLHWVPRSKNAVLWVCRGNSHSIPWPADTSFKQACHAQAGKHCHAALHSLIGPWDPSFPLCLPILQSPWESWLKECGRCVPASISRHLAEKSWLLASGSQNLLFFVPSCSCSGSNWTSFGGRLSLFPHSVSSRSPEAAMSEVLSKPSRIQETSIPDLEVNLELSSVFCEGLRRRGELWPQGTEHSGDPLRPLHGWHHTTWIWKRGAGSYVS